MLRLKTIKGFDSFNYIYKNGKRFRTNNISAVIIFNDEKKQNSSSFEDIVVNFAVVVGKKTSKKSVIRNRIKRLMRESLRILAKEDPKIFFYIDKVIFSCFTAPSRPQLVTLREIMPAIKNILMQAHFFYKKTE